MKNKIKVVLSAMLLSVQGAWAQDNLGAPTNVDAPQGNMLLLAESHPNPHLEFEKSTLPNQTSHLPSDDDILRKQKLQVKDTQPKTQQPPSNQALLDNPDTLEKLLLVTLADGKTENVPTLLALYRQVENRDEGLIEWAEALLLAKQDIRKGIRNYRALLAKLPNNTFIRYQLASALYHNQEFEAAKSQFEKLRASPKMEQEDIEVFDAYLNAIAKKDKWNVNLSASFLNDKNLTDLADTGTKMFLDNGSVLTQTSPKQKGTGFNLGVGLDKQWSLDKGQYVSVDTNANLKYYWNNHAFNELTTYVGASYGYTNAKTDVKATPFMFKRLYAGGDPNADSNKLKTYTNTYGLTLAGSQWLTPNTKFFANYTYGHEKYADDSSDERFGGGSHSVSSSLMYLHGAKQYFGAGIDATRRNAGDKVNAYYRYGGRLSWGQEWPLGVSTNSSLSLHKRMYDEPWLGIVRRENKEWNASVSVWHKAVHFKGITPRLTWQYHKTKSNIPIYSYDKKTLFMEVNKAF